jgi:hypothetical protein
MIILPVKAINISSDINGQQELLVLLSLQKRYKWYKKTAFLHLTNSLPQTSSISSNIPV